MELYHASSKEEMFLCAKADRTKTPIGGTMELLPLCNMNCRMCYVRLNKKEMDAQGRLLTCDEWLKIADEAWHEGLLFLLLTGGEPLLYPEFKRLYSTLSQMGFILSINTNGTLIDEEWADFFARYGCRRLNITLYGKDDTTYGNLCGNPDGFTQVMRAVKLLKKRKVPFRLTCSVTPYNLEQLPELYDIARRLEVPLQASCYMFPAERLGSTAKEQYRLSPEQAGKAVVDCYRYMNPYVDMEKVCLQTLANTECLPKMQGRGFCCHAGHSGFWINWKGEMLPCGMFSEPKISLLEYSFRECWNEIVKKSEELLQCSKCADCELQNICQVCPACCYAEGGSTNAWPEYVCYMTQEMVRQMKKYIQ